MDTAQDAFKAYVTVAGGRSDAARRLGISVAMVGHLLTGARRFSPRLSIAVEHDSDGKHPRSAFRPDLWPGQMDNNN